MVQTTKLVAHRHLTISFYYDRPRRSENVVLLHFYKHATTSAMSSFKDREVPAVADKRIGGVKEIPAWNRFRLRHLHGMYFI